MSNQNGGIEKISLWIRYNPPEVVKHSRLRKKSEKSQHILSIDGRAA